MSYNLLIDGKVYGPVDKKIEVALETGGYQDFIVPDLGLKSIQLSETPETIKASNDGLDGFNSIYIPKIPNDYIGSSIKRINPGTVIPDKNGTIFPAGQYLEDNLIITPIPGEFITPNGTFNIDSNNTYNITNYVNASVNISNLTRYTSGNVTISSNNVGAQTSYSASKLKIIVGFTPKIFIFRTTSYDTGKTVGKFSKTNSIIIQSVNVYNGLCTQGMGTYYTSFLTPISASSSFGSTSVSVSGGQLTAAVGGDMGFYLNPNNSNEVYWYITVSDYIIRSGTWFWEAYA